MSNSYTDPELINEPPEKPQLDKLERCISTDDFRVTTFPIAWTKETEQLEIPIEETNPLVEV
jgi:hypothetical protein